MKFCPTFKLSHVSSGAWLGAFLREQKVRCQLLSELVDESEIHGIVDVFDEQADDLLSDNC